MGGPSGGPRLPVWHTTRSMGGTLILQTPMKQPLLLIAVPFATLALHAQEPPAQDAGAAQGLDPPHPC